MDMKPQTSQPVLFKQLKPLTVPILGMLPIRSPTHSLQLLPSIASIKAILLEHSHPELITPPMIHYIFFPLEQLYHQLNLQALSESCRNQLLELSSLLVRASKAHEPNPLWTSKETLMLNAILPVLIQKNLANASNQDTVPITSSPPWKPARSDESASLALDLLTAILSPHLPPESKRTSLNLDDLSQNPPSLPNLSAVQLRFLFQHLVDILEALYRIYASPKQSQPSLDRARKTIQLARLGLLRLSCSNLAGGNGVDILSTFLPSIASKLTQIACLLAPRRQFSELLGLTLHTIEWLFVACLDDELPDLQEILAASQFQSVDGELDPDQRSESAIYGHVLDIASDWKLGRFRSSPQAATTPPSPASRQDTDAQEVLVKRNQSWLRMTSAKLSIILQRLSSCLDTHPSPIVHEAWVHLCSRLLERTRVALRIIRSCPEQKNSNPPDPQEEKEAFGVLLEALITARSNRNFDALHDQINSALANAALAVPLASVQLIVDFIRTNFRLLSHLLVKQPSGQDDLIIHLSSRIIASLDIIIDLIAHQPRPAHFYQSCFELIDLNEFHHLSTSVLCRVHLVIPKVLESQPDPGSSSGASSIPDCDRSPSQTHQSDRDTLLGTFPKLSVTHIFDHKCIQALEELVRTFSRLVLHVSYLVSGSSIKLSELAYLDRLLQLTTTTKGAKPPDTQHRCLQLNALWTLGESIRASKSISTDERYRARFRKIEIFCLQGLKQLLDMVESYRIEGGQKEANPNESSSSELIAINEGLDNLSVTRYSKGNDQLAEIERLRPASLSRRADALIEEDNFQGLRTCLILRLIASTAYVFEGSFQSNLSWVLYYVLSQLGSPNPYVSQHAMATVDELSFYCGYGSVANMLEDNSDYLIHVVSHQLLPHQYDMHAPFVLEHLIRVVGLRTMLPLVEQILLHDLFALLDDFHGYDLVCEQIISVFRCVMSLMNQEIVFEQAQRKLDAPSGGDDQTTEKTRESTESHIDEIFEIEQQLASARRALAGPPADISTDLEQFQSLQAARSKRDNFQRPSSSADGFVEKNPQKPFGEIDEPGPVDDTSADGVHQESASSEAMTGYQRIAAELMSKSANFLAHSEATVRRGVTQLIHDALPILGAHAVTPHESTLLPVIQRFWTLILHRLDDAHTACESLALLAGLCLHVGAFMGRRLADEIWPRIRTIIGADHTTAGLRKAAIECLAAIVCGDGDSLNWKERVVWDIVQTLLIFQARNPATSRPVIHRILAAFERKGFRDSVRVARRAASGLVPGMEFLAPALPAPPG